MPSLKIPLLGRRNSKEELKDLVAKYGANPQGFRSETVSFTLPSGYLLANNISQTSKIRR